MASEKRGLLYEAIVYRALLNLKRQKLLKGDVFWNETPNEMSIDTDITVGDDPNNPQNLFLISHSTAEHNSDMKFWRNMGEVREARMCLSSCPNLIGVMFDAKFKSNLLLIQPYAFDDYIIVEHENYGKPIIEFAAKNSSQLPSERIGKLDFIEKHVNINNKLAISLKELEDRILVALNKNNEISNNLWKTINEVQINRPYKRIPTAKLTSLRRGLAKMLIFDDIPKKHQLIPKLFEDLGIGRPTLRGTILFDQDINNTLDLLSYDDLKLLHEKYSSMEEFSILVKPLRSLKLFDAFWGYIHSNWSELTHPNSLFKHLLLTHKNSYKLFDVNKETDFIIPGWLVIILITTIKAFSKKRMDFGYSKIVNDIEIIDPHTRKEIILSILNEAQMESDVSISRSSRTIEYGLRDWLFGEHRTNFNLKISELALIAFVLSNTLRNIIGTTLSFELGNLVKEFFVSDTIETKLLSHPSFQPLKALIIAELEKNNIEYQDVSYYPSPLRSLALSDGKIVNIRAGSTNIIRTEKALIRWISVSDAGKTHKCKEFCGRAWGLKIDVDVQSKKIKTHKDIEKIILVIDGTFNNDDLLLLNSSGWDEIYYPNEISDLVSKL